MADDEDAAPKRFRSPPFPFIPLGKAIERAKALYPKSLHHSVGLAVLGEAWSFGLKSSGLIQTTAALIQFGLLVDEGSGDKRKFQLTKEAIRLVNDTDPASEKRKELLQRAALAPKIHREIWDKYGAANISEVAIRNYLMFDRTEGGASPYSQASADDLIEEYKSTILFAELGQGAIPPTFTESNEDENQTKVVDNSLKKEDSDGRGSVIREKQPLKVGMKEDVFSLQEGDVTLQWPEAMSADSYQDLEDWTKLLLRKIKRSITAPTWKND
jgi:hypothetical protein